MPIKWKLFAISKTLKHIDKDGDITLSTVASLEWAVDKVHAEGKAELRLEAFSHINEEDRVSVTVHATEIPAEAMQTALREAGYAIFKPGELVELQADVNNKDINLTA